MDYFICIWYCFDNEEWDNNAKKHPKPSTIHYSHFLHSQNSDTFSCQMFSANPISFTHIQLMDPLPKNK